MQRVEEFGNFNTRIFEKATNVTTKVSPSVSKAPSVSKTPSYSQAPMSPSSSVIGPSGKKMITLCQGNNYITGDNDQECGCNAAQTTVHHSVGDGTNEVDYCTNGKLPSNETGYYCGPSASKLIYVPETNEITYRSNAFTEPMPNKPAVIKRWCA